MKLPLAMLTATALAAGASAQGAFVLAAFTNPQGTTTLVSGGGMYMDIDITSPVVIQALDVNTTATAVTSITVDVYYIPGGWVGNDNTTAPWVFGGGATAVSAGQNAATAVDVADFQLTSSGKYGLFIHHVDSGMAYHTGTTPPGTVTSNFMTLTFGASTGVGGVGTPNCCNR